MNDLKDPLSIRGEQEVDLLIRLLNVTWNLWRKKSEEIALFELGKNGNKLNKV